MKKTRVVILTLVLMLSSTCIGIVFGLINVPEGNIELVDPQEKTLSLGEHFTRDNFVIEASDFFENMTVITVYDGTTDKSCVQSCTGRVIQKTIAKMGDSWNITDDNNIPLMNVNVKDLKEIRGNVGAYDGFNVVVDQRATIRTEMIGRPTPGLSIFPLERKVNNRTLIDRTFLPGSEVSINFSVRNNGKAVLKNVHLVINKSNISNLYLLFPEESLDKELPELKANESTIVNIRFVAPFTEKRKNFTISARVVGDDVFGRVYNATDSMYIVARPSIEKLVEVKKFLPEKVYIGDLVYVTLYVKNNGDTNISDVSLKEIIPSGFEPLDNFSNISNFTLEGNENKLIVYKLKPEKPGIYTFPERSSVVEWKGNEVNNGIDGIEYNNKSEIVIVSGPYVELKKSGIIKNGGININIYAKNIGDRTAIVRLMDFVPGVGNTTKSLIVHPASLVTFSYMIDKNNVSNIIDKGKVTLLPVNAIVFDQFLYDNDRYIQRVSSNYLVLDVGGSV
jgi:uncharacterized repeat protein (TIGR01451 family)